MPKAKDTKMNIGGLMRCCTQTLADFVNENPDKEITKDETLRCKYEKDETRPSQMIFDGIVWRWNQP